MLSEDSHPIHGAFAFAVREELGDVSGVVEQALDADAGSGVLGSVHAVARFAALALALLVIGGAGLLALVLGPEERPRRVTWRAVLVASLGLVLATLVWAAATAAQSVGSGLDGLLRWAPLQDVFATSFGQAWVARIVLGRRSPGRRRSSSFAAAAALPSTSLAAVLAAGIALTFALAGHARVAGPLAVVGDAAHVVAAGVWVGGLALLALALVTAGGDRGSLASRSVPRFSTVALVSVVALLSTGVWNSVVELDAIDQLWTTDYGRLLLAKLALLAALVALGAVHRRVSLPRLRRESAGAVRPFLRVVAVELALMAVVVGVTAALVAEPPPRPAAGSVSVTSAVGPFELTFTVDPARVGSNEIHLYVLDPKTGQPAAVDEIRVDASLPAAGIGPLSFPTTPAGPGHALVAAAELPLAGAWRFHLAVRQGEFDEWMASIDIPIRKE